MANYCSSLWMPGSVPGFAVITAPVLTFYSQVETLRSQTTNRNHQSSIIITVIIIIIVIIIYLVSNEFLADRTAACNTIGYHSNSWASCFTCDDSLRQHHRLVSYHFSREYIVLVGTMSTASTLTTTSTRTQTLRRRLSPIKSLIRSTLTHTESYHAQTGGVITSTDW